MVVRTGFEPVIVSISTLIKQRLRCTSVRKFLHQCFGAYSNSPTDYLKISSRGESICRLLLESCSLLTIVQSVTTRKPNLIFFYVVRTGFEPVTTDWAYFCFKCIACPVRLPFRHLTIFYFYRNLIIVHHLH